MPLTIRPVHPNVVAEVATPDLIHEIEQASDRSAVLILRDQPITDEQHVAFTRPFGRLETAIKAYCPCFKPRLAPEVADISNIDEDTNMLSTRHSCKSSMPTPGPRAAW